MRHINIKFPLEDDTVNNFFLKRNITTKEGLKSNLLLLLFTNKYERYYLPEYGSNLTYYLFEQNDETVKNQIDRDIKESVAKYIPQLKIRDITYEVGKDEHTIKIIIKFTYTDDAFIENDTIEIDLNTKI